MPNEPAKPNLDDLVLAFRREIIDQYRKEGFIHDMTMSQIEIVKFVGAEKVVTMRNIAEHLKITPPSATAIVQELEKKSVLKRKTDLKDRRVVAVTLAPKAQKIYDSMKKHKQNVLQTMLGRLNQKDRESLERIITILITK